MNKLQTVHGTIINDWMISWVYYSDQATSLLHKIINQITKVENDVYQSNLYTHLSYNSPDGLPSYMIDPSPPLLKTP